MKKTFLTFLFLFLVLCLAIIPNIYAQELCGIEEQCNKPNTTCIYFFYGEGCPHCARVEPFINQLELKYNLEVHKFEIYKNRSNLILFNNYLDAYNIPEKERGVPTIFISNKYLIGDKPILENLEKEIINNQGAECPKLEKIQTTGSSGASSPLKKLGALSLVTVIGAAIVDSINPCAIAVLLILLGALLVSGDKKRALKGGFAFTASIYIVYFLFGLGLFSALQITGLSYWFYKIIGILAIIIGLANIKDYFWYGAGGFVMEIPRSWRPTLKKLLNSITSPIGAFLMGFVVCLSYHALVAHIYLYLVYLLKEQQ